MKVHSAEWFANKVMATKIRVGREWGLSMQMNSVVAAATLPQPGEVRRAGPSDAPRDDEVAQDIADHLNDQPR